MDDQDSDQQMEDDEEEQNAPIIQGQDRFNQQLEDKVNEVI